MTDPDIDRLIAAADELLDLEEDRRDLELGAELARLSDEARAVTHAAILRAAAIKAMRAKKALPNVDRPYGDEVMRLRAQRRVALGKGSTELLEWLHGDMAEGAAMLRAAGVEEWA